MRCIDLEKYGDCFVCTIHGRIDPTRVVIGEDGVPKCPVKGCEGSNDQSDQETENEG